MMRKIFAIVVLSVATISTGCSMCSSCNDYGGSHYGGLFGGWRDHQARLNSEYSGTEVGSSPGAPQPEVVETTSETPEVVMPEK